MREELGEARWDAVRSAWQEETRRYGWRAWTEERYACEEGAQPQRETIHARGARRRAGQLPFPRVVLVVEDDVGAQQRRAGLQRRLAAQAAQRRLRSRAPGDAGALGLALRTVLHRNFAGVDRVSRLRHARPVLA